METGKFRISSVRQCPAILGRIGWAWRTHHTGLRKLAKSIAGWTGWTPGGAQEGIGFRSALIRDDLAALQSLRSAWTGSETRPIQELWRYPQLHGACRLLRRVELNSYEGE